MYDLIGDIHGHANELVELLELLGYDRRQGYFSHPERLIVFVGDFIDRGPQIGDVLRIVRPMVDNSAALAVMGNHELNALAYHTRDPDNAGEFLRPHSVKNVRQHRETLQQLAANELYEAVEWFRSLPMWLDLDGVRVVHACWSPFQIEKIEVAVIEYGHVTTEFLRAAFNPNHELFDAVDCVLKGPELVLPGGASFEDKDGHRRNAIRTRWFDDPAGRTFRSYSLPSSDFVPDEPLTIDPGRIPYRYDESEPPVFVGHYWLRAERPTPLAPNVACLDYSVAKNGFLCAYRWGGESELLEEKFVFLP